MIILGAIPFFIAPFIHIIMPKKSQEVKEYIKYVDNLKDEQKTSLENLKESSLANGISLQKYLNQESKLLNAHSFTNTKVEKKLLKLRQNQMAFGFRTMRVFLIGFGTRIVILFLAIILLFSFYVQDEGIKKVIRYISYSFIGVGLYLNIWFLWDGHDYPQSYFYLAIGLMTVIGLITTYLLVTKYESISTKLKGVINQLIVFIIKSEKYIENKSTRRQHLKDYLTEFEKIIK
jgi:predicted PurR-regulated permease PerM